MLAAITAFAPYGAILLLGAGFLLARYGDQAMAARRAVQACTGAFLLSLAGAGAYGLGGSASEGVLRLDPLAATMVVLITFLGAVIVKFSKNYLDGNPRQHIFVAGLCLVLLSVTTLVTTSQVTVFCVAWVGMSLSLHRMLMFYSDRPRATVAARKKFILARIGDTALILALITMAATFGTTSIDEIMMQARGMAAGTVEGEGGSRATLGLITGLLALTAMLKSAQFPTHGWLTEVMETPTPVSALLHAGVVNAGGFLLIRFADVMMLSLPALHVVALVGGFTALFGAFVMLTQTSVKVSLAYSTVAQMGFMLLQCGLGAFSAALVHLVGHSLYKAHAFLSSGQVMTEADAETQTDLADVRPKQALIGLTIAALTYISVNSFIGTDVTKSPALWSLGFIFVAGLAVYTSPLISSIRMTLISVATTLLASLSYIAVQTLAHHALENVAPNLLTPGLFGMIVIALMTLVFTLVAFDQIMGGQIFKSIAHRFYLPLARGLYVNAVIDRVVGSLNIKSTTVSQRGSNNA